MQYITASGATDGDRETYSWQAKCKNQSLTSLIFRL